MFYNFTIIFAIEINHKRNFEIYEIIFDRIIHCLTSCTGQISPTENNFNCFRKESCYWLQTIFSKNIQNIV